MEDKTVIQEKRIQSTIIRRRRAAEEVKPAVTATAEASKVKVDEDLSASAKKGARGRPKQDKGDSAALQTGAEAAEAPIEPSGVEATQGAQETAAETVGLKPEEAIQDPRLMPGGPPVGTILKLNTSGVAAKEEAGAVKGVLPKTEKTAEEEDELFKKAKAAKKKPSLKNIGGDVSEYGDVSQIRKMFVQDRVFQPVRALRMGKKKAKKEGKKTQVTVPKASKRIVSILEGISVGDLAHQMGIKSTEVIKVLMKMGSMATVNQRLDFDTAFLVGQELGWEVKKQVREEERILAAAQSGERTEDLLTRAPIVTVMGHVDHGKTSLLDKIRNAQVAQGEAGGITQHIGAYRVKIPKGVVTFIDTPGHEAFTAMRARGASVTDIVILVVAADDGAKPQTFEAIDHAKAANVPIIVAVNKIDKPEADPAKVKRELTDKGLVPEEWGGSTIYVNVSAKTGDGIEQLLEMILLQAELLELKSNPNKLAKGVIIESRLDKNKGPVATVLVREGTLKLGDSIVVGEHFGRVRVMTNDVGVGVEQALPGVPVEMLGLHATPGAGEILQALADEQDAKLIAEQRQIKLRESRLKLGQKISLEDIYAQLKTGEVFELRMIVKGDVQGSVEALCESFAKLSTDRVKVKVLHSSVGGISESDVMLASASNALIIGFNVRPEIKAIELAKQEKVDIKIFSIIYDATETVKKAMEGLLPKIIKEVYLGRAEVRQVFNVSKIGKVAGCYVVDGLLRRNGPIRLLRDNVIVFEGQLSSLKRFKDDAREVTQGFECGLGIEGFNDLKEGDVVEAFVREEESAKL